MATPSALVENPAGGPPLEPVLSPEAQMQMMVNEIDNLNAELLRKEDELEALKATIEEMKQRAIEDEKRLNLSANASIVKIFSAIPVRCGAMESGRIVVRTRDESGMSIAKPASPQEIDELMNNVITPVSAPAAVPEKKHRFSSRSAAGSAQTAQSAFKGSSVLSRVFSKGPSSRSGTICVAVRFRNDYGQSPPRVTAWMQMAGFISVNTLKPSQMKVTTAGFSFQLNQADLGSAHNMVINWIAVTERPKNPALQTLLETIMSHCGSTLSSSQESDLEKSVSKFISANGTEAGDSNGQTLLHAAASAGNAALVKYLLGKGAHINAVDEHGWTAILCAVSGGHILLAKTLLDLGADGTVITESGSNCLHYLARYPPITEGYADFMTSLLNHGCDPNAYNNDGDTPLSVFCQRCSLPQPITQLLNFGSSVSVANNSGYSPLHIAVINGNLSIVKLLCSHGADINFSVSDKVGSAMTLAQTEGKTDLVKYFESLQGKDQTTEAKDKGVLKSSFSIQIIEARGLPVVSDPYAVIRCGSSEQRTNIVSQTVNPIWKQTFKLNMITDDEITVEVWNYNMAQSCVIFGKIQIKLETIGSVPTELWLPILEVPESEGADSVSSACVSPSHPFTTQARVNGRLHVMLKRTSGSAAQAVDDAFVSHALPKEYWNAHQGGIFADWCIGGVGLEFGYNIEVNYQDVTHNELVPYVFDHHASDYRYAKNFSESSTVVYADVDHNPIVISVAEAPQGQPRKVIVRTKRDDLFLLGPPIKNEINIVKSLAEVVPALQSPTKVKWQSYKSKAIHEELIRFEKLTLVTRYKFGLMYAGPGQKQEDQLFDNCKTSPGFQEFCEFIGTRVTLRGYQGYAGGLDTKRDDTGTESIVSSYGSGDVPLSIMFHVAPMLPFQEDDPQRVERKRHIGNDVCVLIFKDSSGPDDTVDVSTFVSHFNNIFIVVSPAFDLPPGSPPSYRVAVCCKSAIRPFPPFFPKHGNIFEKNEELRTWLLQKLINAERVAMDAPEFRGSMMRTRKQMLSTVIEHCTSKL